MEKGVGKPTNAVKVAARNGKYAKDLGPRHKIASRAPKPMRLTQRRARQIGYFFSSAIFPGITFSGGLVPGGLIERMKAMIFHS
jgi:hypothetical protein